MLEGKILPLGPVTEKILLGTSGMMAVQSTMVFLSLVMRPKINRWINIIFGLVFTLIVTLVITQGGWIFYKVLGMVEITLLLTVIWQSWNWPRVTLAQEKPSRVLKEHAVAVPGQPFF
jgi:hypothetical protein